MTAGFRTKISIFLWKLEFSFKNSEVFTTNMTLDKKWFYFTKFLLQIFLIGFLYGLLKSITR